MELTAQGARRGEEGRACFQVAVSLRRAATRQAHTMETHTHTHEKKKKRWVERWIGDERKEGENYRRRKQRGQPSGKHSVRRWSDAAQLGRVSTRVAEVSAANRAEG